MTTFIRTFIRRRRHTVETCSSALRTSKQGRNIDLPFLNARQLMSYLTPSTIIGRLLLYADDAADIYEATCSGIEDKAVHARTGYIRALA